MKYFILPASVATSGTTLAAVLSDLSFGQLALVYYLSGAIAGLVPHLKWPITLSDSQIVSQGKSWGANDDLERDQVLTANYNRPPCWKKRIMGAFIVALGATIAIFQLVAALRFIF